MNAIKTTICLFLVISFQSCLDLRTCSEDLAGKYICDKNPKAENYLQINEDGSFMHYYNENGKSFEDKGTWKKSDNGYCEIELSNWKNFNELGENYEEFGNGILWISGKNLNIGPDGESSTSFKKSKN
ncbi:hypothetical protein QWY90_03295 [Flavobacterium paronense]|uniref:C-type lysozyme inhibitor domain-containing protein n=1 Tax=Flavobacterium paronense TaxID=1392775 RepID=A0ABV5GG16_9FLAO|nr:hypothetical protein [Flavobacterium paronense]MDN3676333.1 hypothetical protein [Flavobacterium paronense]